MDISKIFNERTDKSIKSIVSIPAWRTIRTEKEVLMEDRATGNLDTAHFLDAIYRRIGE